MCKFCGKQCKQSIISRHIRMAHPKECFEEKALNTPGLKCSICDERYLQKSGRTFFLSADRLLAALQVIPPKDRYYSQHYL